MSKILSGEQLVLSQSRTNRELPVLGAKEFQPTHSWLEKKQIENALEQRRDLLEDERVERQSCLMVAEWDPDKHKATVTVKNKNWEVFGHHSDNADWLFPEEVLYLMEMNCLECMFGEVPLSVQKGYSVLLRPEHGCSPHEYRVFAHLCRMGYRVVRHCAELTVTAYERRIRLDQHLEQRTTYHLATPEENQRPRPDLPPKTVVELPEDKEIVLQSGSLPVSGELSKASEAEEQRAKKEVEVIDVLDSSDEPSSEESSDDSDIEIVHVSAPNLTNKENNKVEIEEESDDSDIEIIEAPVPRKEILVETIESSDSDKDEDEDENNESGSDQSYDGNWKRKQPNRQHYERPLSLVKYMFSAIEEFCNEKSSGKNGTVGESQLLTTENMDVSNEDHENADSLNIEQTPIRTASPKFVVTKSRNEILDLMPTMAGPNRKLIPLESPDLRLIPESITPSKQSYTYSVNSLKARVFRTGFRGRFRGFGPRFGNFNTYQNNNIQSIYPFQMNSLIPNVALTQMFGSDVQSMARGMVQLASALLLNAPINNKANSLSPFGQQPQQNYFNRPNNYFRPSYNSPRISEIRPNNFDSRSSFSNSNYNSFSYARERDRHPLNTQVNNQRSFNDLFDFPNRNLSPPLNRGGSPHSDYRHMRGGPPGRGALMPVPPRTVDPAYVKPDVPLHAIQNTRGRGAHNVRGRAAQHARGQRFQNAARQARGRRFQNAAQQPRGRRFQSKRGRGAQNITTPRNEDQDDVEVVEAVGNNNLTPFTGTNNRLSRKRKRQMKRQLMKQMRLNKNGSPEIIFLDSPPSTGSSVEMVAVKEEHCIKSETITNEQDSSKTCPEIIKSVQTFLSVVKNEVVSGINVKSETSNDATATVKMEQSDAGSNSLSDVQMETSSNDTSLTSSLPNTSLVKSECETKVKLEGEVKSEPKEIKEENSKDEVNKTDLKASEASKSNHENLPDIPRETSVVENPKEIVSQESEEDVRETNAEANTSSANIPDSQISQKNINQQESESAEMDVEESEEVSRDHEFETDEVTRHREIESCEATQDPEISVSSENVNSKPKENEVSRSSVTSWAEVKKHNIPIASLPDGEGKESDSEEDDEEDGDDIRPLIKPKHCKTVGTVLSALQIFRPFSPEVPEDTPKLKMSYDMYLPAEFRKAQRGLPQHRIAVFIESEPMPSAAQLHELQTRFTDNVPVLRAVVTQGSIVFYTCTKVSLTVDVEAPAAQS